MGNNLPWQLNILTHKQVGGATVDYPDGSSVYLAKLACGGYAGAGDGVVLSAKPTCKKCQEFYQAKLP